MSLGLAVAAHLLIALLLLRLAPRMEPKAPEDTPFAAFDVAPATEDTPKSTEQPRAAAKASRSAAAEAAASGPVPPTPSPAADAKPPPMLMLPGGMELFDIGKVRGSADGDADGDTGDSVAAYGPGEGPGGQRLFNAEWYREPSRAELAGYLPAGAPPGGWALIACRTVEDYHVDNCRSLGEGPAGSGLARAMRQAAWQFRVRPPRLGGKAMIGAWVRIRFDFDRQPGGGGTN